LVHLGEPPAGVAGGHDHVAGNGDLEPTAQGQPLNCGDQWLLPPAADDAVLAPSQRRLARPFLQIGAGREHLIAAAEHANPEVVVVVELVEGGVDGGRHLRVDGVTFLHPLHGHHQDAVAAFGAQYRHASQRKARVRAGRADG
jgi:hypothetical protein